MAAENGISYFCARATIYIYRRRNSRARVSKFFRVIGLAIETRTRKAKYTHITNGGISFNSAQPFFRGDSSFCAKKLAPRSDRISKSGISLDVYEKHHILPHRRLFYGASSIPFLFLFFLQLFCVCACILYFWPFYIHRVLYHFYIMLYYYYHIELQWIGQNIFQTTFNTYIF